MLNQKLNLLIQTVKLKTILQVSTVMQNQESYLEQIDLKVSYEIATENEKMKDDDQNDKPSQLSQNTIKEMKEPNNEPVIKVVEPSSPQNTREVEATLAIEAESDSIKKEEDNSNLLSSDDTTKQVDKVNNCFLSLTLVAYCLIVNNFCMFVANFGWQLPCDNEKESKESTTLLPDVDDNIRESTTLLQQAVTTLHSSDTKDLITTRSPLIASLFIEPSKCSKQLIATQPPFQSEQFNELGKALKELNKENAATDYPHLKVRLSKNLKLLYYLTFIN